MRRNLERTAGVQGCWGAEEKSLFHPCPTPLRGEKSVSAPSLPCSIPALYPLRPYLLIAHRSLLIACILSLVTGFPLLPTLAQAAPTAPPPELSPEVFRIAKGLRCPVCQGESAGESNSGVATEMRRIIAEQLAAGKSESEIRAFFVSRYGDWILYEPPKRGATLWVWLSPLIGLGLLGFGLWRYQAMVKARALSTTSDVSDQEIARLEAEIGSTQSKP